MSDENGNEKELTVQRAQSDFKAAVAAKKKLIERQEEDFLFALGKQWSDEDAAQLERAGIKPITDNRIAPNLFLLTGLERQNRTDFRAFPEGEEDGLKAEIASILFKDSIKKSGFRYKSSEQFKDGITAGESHLELFLDFKDNLINGKPVWKKCDSDTLFPAPNTREYDFSDAPFVYKFTPDISKANLINLFPDKEAQLKELSGSKIDFNSMLSGEETHRQRRDYPSAREGSSADAQRPKSGFDLVERYYRKWVERVYIGDMETGELTEVVSKEAAEQFIADYQQRIASDQQAFENSVNESVAQAVESADLNISTEEKLQLLRDSGADVPPEPPQQNPDRYIKIERRVDEIWRFAYIEALDEELVDERAWFYPKWKNYPFVPYYARFSTAPLKGDDRHLLVQGVVHGVKGAQEKHNKAEMLTLRHLNSSANSGWLAEEDSWVDPKKVQDFGTAPGVNLEYKEGKPKPERIAPVQLSTGHAAMAVESAESIKAQTGINSDLISAQQGGGDSGRAIALRQRQGLLMVQELFDNLARSREIAGKFMLSQLGEVYDTDTAMKVLGKAFLRKNFALPPQLDPETGQPIEVTDPETGQKAEFDREMARAAIAEVLSGDLELFDVTVGESVASETIRLAQAIEVRELAQSAPGVVPLDIIVETSNLPESIKNRILSGLRQQENAAASPAAVPGATPAPNPAQPSPGRGGLTQ